MREGWVSDFVTERPAVTFMRWGVVEKEYICGRRVLTFSLMIVPLSGERHSLSGEKSLGLSLKDDRKRRMRLREWPGK